MRKLILIIFCCIIGVLYFQNSLAQPKSSDTETALMNAIRNRDINKVKALIENGANVNEYHNFNSPISIAIETNQINMVKLLIETGADDRSGLSTAVDNNNLEMVKFLLNNNFNIGYSIVYAVENNNMEMVELLTSHGANLNISQKRRDGIFKPKYYVTPIEMAVKNNNKEMCLFLVNKGVSIVAAIDEGFLQQKNDLLKVFIDKSPNLNDNLLKAFKAGNMDIIHYCLDKGADKNIKDEKGKSLLLLATESGDMDIVKFCTEDLKLNPQDVSFRNETSLMLAAQNGNTTLLSYLLQRGVNLEAEDISGETALFYALESGSENAFHFLVGQQANINHASKDNTTLLIKAAIEGQYDVMNYLMEKGAAINTKNNKGQTAYNVVISAFFINDELAMKLIEKGADIEAKNDNGQTLLFIEAEDDHLSKVKYLHSLGANIDTRDNDNYRPDIHSTGMIRFLIENGADINARDDDGNTYMCEAIILNDLSLASFLVSKGIDLDQNCYFEECPLIKAIEDNNFEFVKFLVENGADVNNTDRYGKNVLERSLAEGNMQIIQYLSGSGATTRDQANLGNLQTQSIDNKLKTALKNEDADAVENLLKENNPADLDKDISKEIAILGTAKGKLYLVDYALNHLGIGINDVVNLDNQTLLIIAAISNKINSVNYLLDHGADKGHKDYFNKIALDYAIEKEIKEILK